MVPGVWPPRQAWQAVFCAPPSYNFFSMQLREALEVADGDVVGLVGAGGKSTAMYRLADELVAAGRRVVTAKSTVVIKGTVQRSPCALRVASLEEALERLPEALYVHGQAMVVTGEVREGLYQGMEAAWACEIVRQPWVDNVIVEADGARHRWLKAPAGHEPSLPACVSLVVPTASAAAFGHPLNSESVHRPEIAAELVGAREGDAITPELVATLLLHPCGGLKDVPADARVSPLIAAVTEATASEARAAAALLLAHARVERVILHWRTQEGTPGAVEALG